MTEVADGIGTRVLFENEHVRVWENVLEPGEESPVHRHGYDYLIVDIDGDRLIHNPITGAHYERMEYEVVPGFIEMLMPGGTTETAINVGERRYRGILIELLDNPR